jgi:RimJ/RimL family protein N-acetyltransferase
MIVLWPAEKDDEAQILEWRNDPFIYSKGHTGKPVTQEDHRRWFKGQLSPGDHDIFMIQDDNLDNVGVIRYEIDRMIPAAMISIFLPEKNCGKGYGTDAIQQCCAEIRQRWPKMRIMAEIHPQNIPSIKAFKKAGFINMDEFTVEFFPPGVNPMAMLFEGDD